MLIRRDPARAAQIRAKPGSRSPRLAFGGRFDLATRRAFRREIADLAPGHRADLDEPRDAVLPARRFRPSGAARRLLRPEILSPLRSSDRQHPGDRRLCDSPRLAARPGALSAEFRSRSRAARSAGLRGRAERRWRSRSAGCIRTRGLTCCSKRSPLTRESILWIAGDGAVAAALASARRPGSGSTERVRFLGWQDDVGRLLADRRSARLSVAARAARQCRDRGLVGRRAGRRDGERRAGRR